MAIRSRLPLFIVRGERAEIRHRFDSSPSTPIPEILWRYRGPENVGEQLFTIPRNMHVHRPASHGGGRQRCGPVAAGSTPECRKESCDSATPRNGRRHCPVARVRVPDVPADAAVVIVSVGRGVVGVDGARAVQRHAAVLARGAVVRVHAVEGEHVIAGAGVLAVPREDARVGVGSSFAAHRHHQRADIIHIADTARIPAIVPNVLGSTTMRTTCRGWCSSTFC
ncbi:hypothetical protein B0H10DRAFT_1951988 [Mycena sp. CBHHK59/15]|nr:hypothetical protein B0H10DRAFT_1951988 [Mycena sp. CBHHK59/15]